MGRLGFQPLDTSAVVVEAIQVGIEPARNGLQRLGLMFQRRVDLTKVSIGLRKVFGDGIDLIDRRGLSEALVNVIAEVGEFLVKELFDLFETKVCHRGRIISRRKRGPSRRHFSSR